MLLMQPEQPEQKFVEIVKVQDVVERSANSVSNWVPKYEQERLNASAEPSDDKGTLGHACLPRLRRLCDHEMLVRIEVLTLSRLRMAQSNKTLGGSRAQKFASRLSVTVHRIANAVC